MSDEDYNAALRALMERRAAMSCSRCGFNQFELQPAYTSIPLVPDCNLGSSYGPSIPCAIVACKNCGNLSFHSVVHLGLLRSVDSVSPSSGMT